MIFKILSNLSHNGQFYKIGETIEGDALQFADLLASKVIVAAEQFDEAIKAKEQEIEANKPDVTPASPVAPDLTGKGEDTTPPASTEKTGDVIPPTDDIGANSL